MIMDVSVRILSRSVFIAEETLQCEIEICYKYSQDEGLESQLNNKSWNKTKEGKPKDSITIAYASAQIYCQCILNERKLKFPSSNKLTTIELENEQHRHTTAFLPAKGEKGRSLYNSKAVILFCDLKLYQGETKKYIYKEQLPRDIPPSYKGQYIKLTHKVCVGIGLIDKPVHIIKIPFRVFEFKGILKSLKEKGINQKPTTQQQHTVNTVNPFLQEKEEMKVSKLDIAMEALTAFTVKRNLNTYNIQSMNDAVGRFCLSKYYYRVGEEILGTFDFSNCPISCVKYTVSLQLEETISKNCLLAPSNSNLVHYNTVTYHEECCYMSTKTNFQLPIPITATPEFIHKIVSVRWRLHFEFTIVVGDKDPPKSENDDDKNNDVKGQDIPLKLKTELMLWDLPIHVVATNPIQASLMTQEDCSVTSTL